MAIMEIWKAEAEAMQTVANVKTRIVVCEGGDAYAGPV